MKQTMSSIKESPLLTYAISRLNPEVFSHPVWVRFGRMEESIFPGIVEVFIKKIRTFQKADPSDACQLMLICAIYQNYSGQSNNALTTIQQVIALAKQNGLGKEILWANWGACAICVQNGDYGRAAHHLEELRIELNKQKDWVLANFIEEVKQSSLQRVADNTSKQLQFSREKSHGSLLSLTFDWLHQWGIPYEVSDADFRGNINLTTDSVSPQTNQDQHSSFGWLQQDFRQILKSMFKGKMKLQRAEINSPFERKEGWDAHHVSQKPAGSIPPIVKTCSPPNTPIHGSKSSSINELIPKQTAIPMTVQMLGKFDITLQETPLNLHTTRGLSVLKYLLFHHKQTAPREVLMDIFWQNADPDAARNNLNVAMHNLRQAFRAVTDLAVIRFEDGAYSLTPDLEIWLDVEEFERCIKTGQYLETRKQMTAAVSEYEIAVNLYRGDFLADTPYESWTVLDRERLRISYLDTLDHLSQIYFSQDRYAMCVTLCQIILNRDPCREDAHCRLMQCYSRMGQGSLALRQYQVCVKALRSELEVDPAPETMRLYERIRHHEGI